VSFFSQRLLPLLDEEGNMFLDDVDSIAQGPDGNGFALKYFAESGLWHAWQAQGIRYINMILIDNPLADPFDVELVGFHERDGCDITVKCTPRRDIHEKVGVLVKVDGKAAVVEYTELSDDERKAHYTDGTLKHLCANLSLFCFSLDAIHKLNKQEMPLHLAHKAVKYVDKTGQVVQAGNPMAWKFERFIFDVLPLAEHVKALLYPRTECFAPLKNFSGPDSPGTVQAALQEMDRRVIEKITGLPAPQQAFELAQEFYYPTPELLQKWQGRALPSEKYIEP
jgi:UDP-N-acetylglucosamine/UDP-N-acetylgalactosamine diphosphorylase